ncbi:hypothetical protein CDEST_15123 [Colletotrichum destructivum]|uniref:Uncharacterized protein n=1 Tax=Colletotrichum destructivum TaxID=34406 RepID=A0AAX4J3X5_9PEZI|nr:hypothetical protein CDEST_15123 [Colletotrichum destructivum]
MFTQSRPSITSHIGKSDVQSGVFILFYIIFAKVDVLFALDDTMPVTAGVRNDAKPASDGVVEQHLVANRDVL